MSVNPMTMGQPPMLYDEHAAYAGFINNFDFIR